MESLLSLLRSNPPTLKALLTDLGCEAINGSESEEEVEELMTQPCRERDLVMGWLADLLEKDKGSTLKKNQNDAEESTPPKLDLLATITEGGEERPGKSAKEMLVAMLSEKAIPKAKDLVEGKLEKRLQLRTWMLALRTVKESRACATKTGEEVSGELAAALSRPLSRLGENPEPLVRLLPRDIDREVRPKFKKILPPSEAKLGQIIQSMREDMDMLRAECEEMGDHQDVFIDSQEVDDLSDAVEDCEKRLGDFGMSYESTYGRWVERQGAVEEPESIGEAAVEIRNALRENAAMRKANAEVRSRVLALKEKAAQLEAISKFKSGIDKERS